MLYCTIKPIYIEEKTPLNPKKHCDFRIKTTKQTDTPVWNSQHHPLPNPFRTKHGSHQKVLSPPRVLSEQINFTIAINKTALTALTVSKL